MKRTRVALAAGLSAALAGAAWAAGNWSTLPIVGNGSFCGSTVTGTGGLGGVTGQGQGSTGSICGQTVPAGPPGVTGSELIPADTTLSGGAPPQTVTLPTGLLAPAAIYQGAYPSPKNLLRNGDLSVNPWQSGTSQAADVANTVTTAADGFRVVGGASSLINWSQQTGASDIVANQFTKSLRFQRKATNANTVQICQISVLTSAESVALQGRSYVYSFWSKPGANISPSNGAITVKVAWGTSSDDTSANFKSGSWSGYTDAVTAGGSSVAANPVSVATAIATAQTLPTGSTAGWVQYWVSGTIGTTATQVGTEICMTPVGTAGTNDWVETSNHQLEVVGPGVVTPTAFEHHLAGSDLAVAQRFLWVVNEGAGPTPRAFCNVSTANSVLQCLLSFPQPMRAGPTMTYAAGFAVPTTTAQTALTACSGLAADATEGTLVNGVNATLAQCTSGGTTAAVGLVLPLFDNGGTGKITASAEL